MHHLSSGCALVGLCLIGESGIEWVGVIDLGVLFPFDFPFDFDRLPFPFLLFEASYSSVSHV